MTKETIDIKIAVKVNDEVFFIDKQISVMQYKSLVCPDLLINDIFEKVKKEIKDTIKNIIK